MGETQSIRWLRNDYSRVPNSVYHDPNLYELEQKRIFEGPVWMYLGLDAEIPNPGDFRTTWLGANPVVFNRDTEGSVHAFVNLCAHRGAIVRRELCGNAQDHVCVYHQWCYDPTGALVGVPFARGIAGKGGMSKEFRREDHALRKLRVENFRGILFASFSDETVPLTEYLGPVIAAHLTRLMHGKVRIIGYQRQKMRGNWKAYAENTRDQYHGSLLHKFLGTFFTKTTTLGGLHMDPRHRHSLVYSTPAKTFDAPLATQADLVHNVDSFADERVLRFIPEFGPDYEYGNAICSFFPNAVFQQIRNNLATRQIRPRGTDSLELLWTIFGFEDDDEELRRHRLMQMNLGGPAGFVASEDGEAIELVHKATKDRRDTVSLLEMGGTGPLTEFAPTRMNELALRGFWSYYSELMGTEPPDAIR